MDINALAKAAADKAAAAVLNAHRAKMREVEEQRRRAEERAAELKRQRVEVAKKNAQRQQQAEHDKAAEAERQRAAEAARKAAHGTAQQKRTVSNAAGKSSAGAAGMSERAAGKRPEREALPEPAERRPQAPEQPQAIPEEDEEDGEDEEEDVVRQLDPTGEMETWMEVMEHAEKLGMPKWAQSLSLRLFELDRDQARMEDRMVPQLSRMTTRLGRVRGRYDGVERQVEELGETVHDGLARINRRMDAFEHEMRTRLEKLEERIDKRVEAVRYEWREGLWQQNGSVAGRLEEYGERMQRWHDRFAELEVIVGAHVPDWGDYTIQLPVHPPKVIRVPRLPDDDEDLARMQDDWIAEEFRLGYSGQGDGEAEDDTEGWRLASEDDQTSG